MLGWPDLFALILFVAFGVAVIWYFCREWDDEHRDR